MGGCFLGWEQEAHLVMQHFAAAIIGKPVQQAPLEFRRVAEVLSASSAKSR